MKNKKKIREGLLQGSLPYIAVGDGPPLVIIRSNLSNENPTGLSRWAEMRMLLPYSGNFTVYAISRKPGINQGASMSDLASGYASAIKSEFGEAVNILGISTGGSIAQ